MSERALQVKCEVCGEPAGKPCRDYAAIPFRATRIERLKTVMRNEAPMRAPHQARIDAVD